MIVLDATTKSLELVLDGAVATNQLPYVLSYAERFASDQSLSAIGENDGLSNSGTAVTLLAAPDVLHTRQVKFLSVENKDTAPRTATLQINNNGTKRPIVTVTLAVGDTLIYTD